MKRFTVFLLLIGTCLSFICAQSAPLPISQLIEVYNNPLKYPNYIMLSAHRGYWKDIQKIPFLLFKRLLIWE